MAFFPKTQSQARHHPRRKETNWTSRLESIATQLSISWLKISPPICNVKSGIFALVSPSVWVLFLLPCLCMCMCVCLFLKSQTRILSRSIGISKVIGVLGYCRPKMWVIAEQPDKHYQACKPVLK